jgi:hypothetical protein
VEDSRLLLLRFMTTLSLGQRIKHHNDRLIWSGQVIGRIAKRVLTAIRLRKEHLIATIEDENRSM